MSLQFIFFDRSRANLDEITCEVHELEEKVINFKGEKNDQDYKQLDEWLTSSLLNLDAIESDGDEDIQEQRKEIVDRIHHSLDELDGLDAPNQMEDKENQNPLSESPKAESSNQKSPRKRKSKKGLRSLYYLNSPQESENEEQDMVSQNIR